jgi:hypothetical protein
MMGRRVRQLYTRDNIQLTQTKVLSTETLAGGGGGGGGEGRGEERTCIHIKCSTLWTSFIRNGKLSSMGQGSGWGEVRKI